jgi:transcriptional regulator with PAS, ATPase and Fis domain
VVVLCGSSHQLYDVADDGDVIVGRATGCPIAVDDPSLSRHHATLHIAHGNVTVEDLDSVNGTFIGGERLPPHAPRPLSPGSVLELGTVTLVLQRARTGAAASSTGDRAAAAVRPSADPMRELSRLVERIAKSTLSVLVLGETGAGKEMIAQRIHDLSPRADKPFLRLHCAALSESLLESELFGHERGAFTGAVQQKLGLLETAHRGTVFLDEVGELPLATQVKLLRVLEDKKVLRVGGLEPRTIDVRFVAATNRDLEQEVAEKRFRQDLFFRLNGITLYVPPLRERRGEIEPLAHGFAGDTKLSRAALARLASYDWPGNVRELRNVIERAVVLAGDGQVLPEHLGLDEARARPSSAPSEGAGAGDLKTAIGALEYQRIIDALAACGGNQTQAARMLGISRGTLIARLQRYELPRPRKT